jgi:hypothetical protein
LTNERSSGLLAIVSGNHAVDEQKNRIKKHENETHQRTEIRTHQLFQQRMDLSLNILSG